MLSWACTFHLTLIHQSHFRQSVFWSLDHNIAVTGHDHTVTVKSKSHTITGQIESQIVTSHRPQSRIHRVRLHSHTVTRSHCHTVTLSHRYTVTPSHCHTVTVTLSQTHCHSLTVTVALSQSHSHQSQSGSHTVTCHGHIIILSQITVK